MSESSFNSREGDGSPVEPVLEFENVHKTYLLGVEGIPALRGVSLKVYPGEFLIVYGTSGGGKTTLLNIMGTIDKPTKGHMRIGATRITSSTPDASLANIRLFQLGFVFQTFNLLSSMTARENVEMPMVLAGRLNAKERKERSLTLLDRVGIKARADHLPSQLSGGEQQRVTIARAIANKPDILLLDEPTGDLDTYNTMVVMDMLLRLNETEGITMVMVTHDPNLKFLASRVVYMRDGRVFRDDPVDPEIRRLEIAKLNGELNAARVERQMRSGQHGDQASIDETSGEVQVPFTDATEFRKPQDYHTFVAQRPLAEEDLAMGRRREQNFAQFLQGGSASSSAASGPVASSSASSSASASNSVRA